MLMCMLLDMLFVVLLVAESPKAWKEHTWVIFHPIIKKFNFTVKIIFYIREIKMISFLTFISMTNKHIKLEIFSLITLK